MTIQEMFDLLREYRNAVDRVNSRPDTTLTPKLRKIITEEYLLAQKVACYLPRFTPMHCKFCKHNDGCKHELRPFGMDHCAMYEVESLEDFLQ